ncbi:MAG: potassium channel family protein [Alphaproteobacteria bacterium]
MIVIVAFALVAVTVAIHAVGLAALYAAMVRRDVLRIRSYWVTTRQLIVATWVLTMVHVLEIAVWAVCYWSLGCLPDLESALYFSGVTYATIGFGDIVLPQPWRLLAPIEGLVGILMAGLSTGFFFAVITQIYANARPGQMPFNGGRGDRPS